MAWLLGVLLLAGCAPAQRVSITPRLTWEQRLQRMQALDNWSLSGRLALQIEEEGWHASLDWRQQGARYRIRITAPLGQGSAEIRGMPGSVVLDYARAEDLLYRLYGWTLPVANLRYWLLGVTAPGEQVSPQLDDHGRLAGFRSGLWEVRIVRYGRHGDYELPEKIVVQRPGYRLKLVVSQWSLPT